MLLRETMWEIFLSTGNIDAYLAYRECVDYRTCQHEFVDEPMGLLNGPQYNWNNLLREVRWQ